MTTLTKLADLAKYVPMAEETSGWQKLSQWLRVMLEGKDIR
jgi:hypothetical protein